MMQSEIVSTKNNWSWGKLLDFCDIQTGKRDVDEGNPEGEYVFFTCAYSPTQSDTYSFDGEHLILPGNGANVGECFYFNGKFEAYQRTYILNNFRINPKFLYYYFQQNWRKHLHGQQLGSATNYILMNNFAEFKVPNPPIEVQEAIASLLARADRLRQLRRTAHDLGDALLQSVFLEMFGEYLNKIECQFGDVLEIPLTNGFFEKNDKYGEGNPIVWVDNLYHTNIIDTTNLRRVQVSQKDLDKYAVIEGDLLFTRSSLVAEGVGRANIVPKLEEQTMFESHVIRARVDKKKINPFFALGLFRSQFGIAEMMKRAKTATMTTIGQDTLYEFPCMLPPLNLQEEFAGVVARVESLRGRMGESTRGVEGLFESLLAESFG